MSHVTLNHGTRASASSLITICMLYRDGTVAHARGILSELQQRSPLSRRSKEIEGDRGQRKLAAEPKWKVDTPQGNIVRTPREKEKRTRKKGGN